MKSTLIELPPELEEASELMTEDLEFLDELSDAVRDVKVYKPGEKFGPYHVLGFVAAGGMGEVYAAERVMEDGRRLGPVALKVMAPDYRDDWMVTERFKRESKISRAIRSPHVPRVFEFGQADEGHLFLVMELLRGEELFDRLCARFTLPPLEVARLTLQILEGLKAIHDHGFVHRDLKPENIYFHQIDPHTEVVKILDFGIAKTATQESDPYLSVVGRIYGTPEYIAPEQGLNPDVDQRADLYSIGVIMYECLSGVLPFEGDTPYVTILMHQTEKMPRMPSNVPEDLVAIVAKALEKDPDNRFQSATEMEEEILAWIAENDGEEIGVSIRDSGQLLNVPSPQPGPQHDTPAPVPQPSKRTEKTNPNNKRRRKRQIMQTENLPPIEIFTKKAPEDVPKEISEAAEQVVPAKPEESNTDWPTIITTAVLLVVVIAMIWTFYG